MDGQLFHYPEYSAALQGGIKCNVIAVNAEGDKSHGTCLGLAVSCFKILARGLQFVRRPFKERENLFLGKNKYCFMDGRSWLIPGQALLFRSKF